MSWKLLFYVIFLIATAGYSTGQPTARGQTKIADQRETGCSENQEDLANTFTVFDKNGSGYIEWEELKYVMQGTGEPLTDEGVSAMMNEADKDGDGIDYQEFVAMMQGDCISFK